MSVEVKVTIPPRRRSATLAVDLTETREAKAVVNVKSVRLTLSDKGSRYPNTQAVTIPRDLHALNALGQLIDAIKAEVVEQAAWSARDEQERGAVES